MLRAGEYVKQRGQVVAQPLRRLQSATLARGEEVGKAHDCLMRPAMPPQRKCPFEQMRSVIAASWIERPWETLLWFLILKTFWLSAPCTAGTLCFLRYTGACTVAGTLGTSLLATLQGVAKPLAPKAGYIKHALGGPRSQVIQEA